MFACAAFGIGLSAMPEGNAGLRGSAYASLGGDELSMRLSLGKARSYFGLGLEAKDEDMGLEGCLRLGSSDGEGAYIVAGPGSASGVARVLIDPTSSTPLTREIGRAHV